MRIPAHDHNQLFLGLIHVALVRRVYGLPISHHNFTPIGEQKNPFLGRRFVLLGQLSAEHLFELVRTVISQIVSWRYAHFISKNTGEITAAGKPDLYRNLSDAFFACVQ